MLHWLENFNSCHFEVVFGQSGMVIVWIPYVTNIRLSLLDVHVTYITIPDHYTDNLYLLLQNCVHFHVVLKKYVCALYWHSLLANRLITNLLKEFSSKSLSIIWHKKSWKGYPLYSLCRNDEDFNAGDSETGLLLILMSMNSRSQSPSLNTLSH